MTKSPDVMATCRVSVYWFLYTYRLAWYFLLQLFGITYYSRDQAERRYYLGFRWTRQAFRFELLMTDFHHLELAKFIDS